MTFASAAQPRYLGKIIPVRRSLCARLHWLLEHTGYIDPEEVGFFRGGLDSTMEDLIGPVKVFGFKLQT